MASVTHSQWRQSLLKFECSCTEQSRHRLALLGDRPFLWWRPLGANHRSVEISLSQSHQYYLLAQLDRWTLTRLRALALIHPTPRGGYSTSAMIRQGVVQGVESQKYSQSRPRFLEVKSQRMCFNSDQPIAKFLRNHSIAGLIFTQGYHCSRISTFFAARRTGDMLQMNARHQLAHAG